jgi:putative tryptophan/tyrosine transport system substrate-binding protein
MIDRRTLLTMAAAATTAPAVRAQSTPKRPIVGLISAVGRNVEQMTAFEAGLRENGLEPGRHLDIVERYAEGNIEKMRRQIQELAGLNPAVFVTAGDNAMRLIQERTPKVPIVVAVLGNYGNVTGFANLSAELATKRLDILREVVPGLDHVVLLVNPNIVNPTGQPDAYRNAADSLRMTIRMLPVRPGMDVSAAIHDARDGGARGIVVYRNFLFETVRAEIAAAIASARLPSMFEERFFVDMGGLISYSTNLADLFRRSGGYVAKVLAGTTPGDLPVQLPSKFELVVNLKAAQALGLAIPPRLLVLADEVIE